MQSRDTKQIHRARKLSFRITGAIEPTLMNAFLKFLCSHLQLGFVLSCARFFSASRPVFSPWLACLLPAMLHMMMPLLCLAPIGHTRKVVLATIGDAAKNAAKQQLSVTIFIQFVVNGPCQCPLVLFGARRSMFFHSRRCHLSAY